MCSIGLIAAALSLGLVRVHAQTPSNQSCTAVASQPHGASCALRGTARGFSDSDYLVHYFTHVDDVNECAGLNARRGHVSFVHDPSAQTCFTFNEPVHFYHVTSNASSPAVWYDAACFHCAAVCPWTVGQNMLANGGAEASSTYYGPWEQTTGPHGQLSQIALTAPGHNSSQAFTCPRGVLCGVQQSLKSCRAGHPTYLASVDVLVTAQGNGAWNVTTAVGSGGVIPSYMRVFAGRGSLGWTTLRMLVSSRGDEAANLAVMADTLSSLMNLDNLSLTPVGPLTPVSGAKNLVPNPGFESGTLENWTVIAAGGPTQYSISSPGLQGSGYCFNSTSGPNAVGNTYLRTASPLRTAPGAMYVLDFAVAQAEGRYDQGVQIYFGTGGGGFNDSITDYVYTPALIKPFPIGRINATFVAERRETVLTLVFATTYDPSTWVAVDDVRFRRVS